MTRPFWQAGGGFLTPGSSGGSVNPRQQAIIYDEFVNTVDNFTYGVAGSGLNTQTGGFLGHPGVLQQRVSALNDRASYITSTVALVLGSFAGGGAIRWEALIQVPILSTAAEEYVWQLGCGDTNNADQVDGVYLEYDRTASTEWRMCASQASTRTKTNSGVAVTAAAWVRAGISIAADGLSASFDFDGTVAGTLSTNLPSGTQAFGIFSRITKTVQTAAAIRDVYTDYVSFTQALSR